MTTASVTRKHARAIVAAAITVRELASALAVAESHQREVEAEARAAGFQGGEILYKGEQYSIATATTQKFSVTAEDAELVAFAKAHGLKTTPPRPESCSSSTIRAAALRGIDVSQVCDVITTEVYAVSVH